MVFSTYRLPAAGFQANQLILRGTAVSALRGAKRRCYPTTSMPIERAVPRTLLIAASIEAGAPLLVIGLHDAVERWLASHKLPAAPVALQGRGSAIVWTAPLPQGKSLAVVSARDADALSALVRPLPHYGRASYLVFEGSKAIERGVWPSRAQIRRF